MDKSRESNARIIFPLILIFILLTFITIYTTRMLFDASVSNIHEVGEDRIAGVGAELENYLYTAKSVLWATADTVDYMSRNDISNDQILNYLVEESDRQAKQFDDSYTGIYGYINGEYLDGVGWEPPAGYVPTERDWYKVGSAAGGESAIVPPYVDAQTGAIIISISRKLPSSTDVLSLDLTLDNVQRMASQLKVKGKGSGFVIDGSGLIIAHTNEENKGKYLEDVIPDAGLLNEIKANGQGYFVATIEGDKNTVFVEPVMDQWYAVITISDRELFQDVVRQMIINVVICASIFIMIAFFYSLSFKNERDYSRRVQEMKLEEQAQAQERKALELEKNAADESSKAKTDFIAGMSGKIQKPVNEIISMDEQILAETDDERIRTNAVGIRRTGRKVLSIINDIIDLSKIETGKMELSVSEYETADLIDDFVKETKADAEEKGLDYILSVSDNIPSKLVGDKERVEQIIINLVSNAIKYTNSGKVEISLTYDAKPSLLGIVVSDTGRGMRPDDLEKIFDVSGRERAVDRSTIESSGLGLGITGKLVEMMDGEISAKSKYGEGATFTAKIVQRTAEV